MIPQGVNKQPYLEPYELWAECQTTPSGRTSINPILRMRKLRLQKIKRFAQGHENDKYDTGV